MKRADEVLVGVVVLIGIAVTIAGSVWLSEVRLGASDIVREARFRSAGQLQVGNPVLLRGVKIGRVEAVRLDSTARNQWVRVTLRLKGTEKLPNDPVAIIFSATLFGDWAVQLLDRADLPNDPEVRRQVNEAALGAGRTLPGAALPDIGQLTAQAGRIAGEEPLHREPGDTSHHFGHGSHLDPLAPEHLEAHRRELLTIVRRLLGIRAPRAVGSRRAS